MEPLITFFSKQVYFRLVESHKQSHSIQISFAKARPIALLVNVLLHQRKLRRVA